MKALLLCIAGLMVLIFAFYTRFVEKNRRKKGTIGYSIGTEDLHKSLWPLPLIGLLTALILAFIALLIL